MTQNTSRQYRMRRMVSARAGLLGSCWFVVAAMTVVQSDRRIGDDDDRLEGTQPITSLRVLVLVSCTPHRWTSRWPRSP
jgi:hypothetical protein